MTYKILSLDGGGIRGVIPARFLERLENSTGKSIYDLFDLICGTSTGGLIALHIAANNASGANCVDLYNPENAAKIMYKSLFDKILPIQNKPKYDGEGKREFLQQIFGDKRLLDVKENVLITSFDIVSRESVIFKSFGGNDSKHNPKVAEVADATSAAPTFFPTISTESLPRRWLIDGGFAANDPAMCGISEALKIGYKTNEIKLLSIGTGILRKGFKNPEKYGESSKKWGGIGWLNNGLVDNLFAGNSSTTQYFSKQILGKNYLRIDGELINCADELDDVSPKNIENLKFLGDNLFSKLGHKAKSALT